MAMGIKESAVIAAVVARLECRPHSDGFQSAAPEVVEALRGPARLYLDTWVTGALRCLLPDPTAESAASPFGRDVDLAYRLADAGRDYDKAGLPIRCNQTQRVESAARELRNVVNGLGDVPPALADALAKLSAALDSKPGQHVPGAF